MFFAAWERLLAMLPGKPPELILAGHGQGPDSLTARRTGYVDSAPKMAELYNVADILVHPSLLDNLPNTSCEAQCCGLPVLAFNTGGNSETFIAEETGFIAPEVSAQGLALKLREIIEQPARLHLMRAAARRFAEHKFNPAKLTAEYLEVLAQAAEASDLTAPDEAITAWQQNKINSLGRLLPVLSAENKKRFEQKLAAFEGRLALAEEHLAATEQRLLKAENQLSLLKIFTYPLSKIKKFLLKQ
jgi:hypothetical protein